MKTGWTLGPGSVQTAEQGDPIRRRPRRRRSAPMWPTSARYCRFMSAS